MSKKIIILIILILCIIGCGKKSSKIKIIEKKDLNITKMEKPLELSGYYKENTEVALFIDNLVINEGFNYNYLIGLFSNLKFQNRSLALIAPKKRKITLRDFVNKVKKVANKKTIKKPKIGSWDRYKNRAITQKRVDNGVAFYKKNIKTLKKAYKKYGITPEYIVGLMGIETKYGTYIGEYPVFDTLATLGFEKHRRSKFFKRELKYFLRMVKSEDLNISNTVGSYAGAIGYGQFMPSNFNRFAVDFNKDGVTDLWNVEDAIGSVANYLNKHGWQKDEPVAVRAKYRGIRFKRLRTGYKRKYSQKRLKRRYKIEPREKFSYKKRVRLIKLKKTKYDQLWFGTKNFYVITRYNHSSYYAMAIHQLSQKIKESL